GRKPLGSLLASVQISKGRSGGDGSCASQSAGGDRRSLYTVPGTAIQSCPASRAALLFLRQHEVAGPFQTPRSHQRSIPPNSKAHAAVPRELRGDSKPPYLPPG